MKSSAVTPAGSLDAYNYVGQTSHLSHQNVNSLLRHAFTNNGLSGERYNELVRLGSVETVVIGAVNLDRILRDAILKFIGQKPQEPQASFALCRGYIEREEIRGDTHWTALHLKRVPGANGTFSIEFSHMDSMGGGVPDAVQRVIGSIRSTTLNQLTVNVSRDSFYKRGLEILHEGKVILKECKFRPCITQINGHSCGDHAVYNLVAMANGQTAADPDSQESKIVNGRSYLQTIFNKEIDDFKVSRNQKSSSSLAANTDKKTTPSSSIEDDINILLARVFSVIDDPGLNYSSKLTSLVAINSEIVSKAGKVEDENINAALKLSILNIEESYKKLLEQFSESIRYFCAKKRWRAPVIEEFLEILNNPQIWQNPEKVILFISQLELLFKNLEQRSTKKDLHNLIDIVNKIVNSEDSFLSKIDGYTENLQSLNKSFAKAQPEPNPTKPLSADTAANLNQTQEEKQKLLKSIIAAQKDNPRPEFPYQGLGVATKIVGGRLKITEDFNANGRFKNGSGLEINLVSQYITGGKYEDPKNKGTFISFNIDNIFKEENDTRAAMRRIASIFHGEGTINFEVVDSSGNMNKIEYERSEKDVYVTRRCKFLNTATISDKKNGAQYDSGIHGFPPVTSEITIKGQVRSH
jgi:hypothetical protein